MLGGAEVPATGAADAAATGTADAAATGTFVPAGASHDDAGASHGSLQVDHKNPVNNPEPVSTTNAQYGGSYQMIVPAAMVLANNYIGRGRSLRYRGKGAYRPKSSRFSRRRRATRRGYKK